MEHCSRSHEGEKIIRGGLFSSGVAGERERRVDLVLGFVGEP
jgi:hypothetical protein